MVGDYSRELTAVGTHADLLASTARSWRATAPSVLAACRERIDDELAVLDARDLAEEREVLIAKAEAERELLTRSGQMDIAEAQSKLAEAVAQLRAIERLRKQR